MRIKKLLRSLTFWLTFLIGTLAMLSLNLGQLGWLAFVIRPEVWSQIDLASLDIWLAVLISILVGWNLAGLIYLARCDAEAAGKTGFLGLTGAVLGWFAFYCVACQALLFSIFGLAIGVELITPYIPALRVFSVILLLWASWLTFRKIQQPNCRI